MTEPSTSHTLHSFLRTLQRTGSGTDKIKRLIDERKIVFYRRDLKYLDRAHWIFWSEANRCAARLVVTADFRHLVTVIPLEYGVPWIVSLARSLAQNPGETADMSKLDGERLVPVHLVLRREGDFVPSAVSARVSVEHLASDNVLTDRRFIAEVARSHPSLLPAHLHQAVFFTGQDGGVISSHVSFAGETVLRPRRR